MRRLTVRCACIFAFASVLAAVDLLDASRRAVAGALPPIQSLKMTGRLRQAAGRDTDIDGVVDVRVLLPRRAIRIDTIDGRQRGAVLDSVDVMRLMLGVAGTLVGDDRVQMTAVTEEPFPDTRSLDLTGRTWSLRFVMDAASSLPLRLVYFGGGRGTTVVSFADRRNVDGYQIPHRITTTTAERVLETLMFDEVAVNPKLTEADLRLPPAGRP